MTYFIKTFVVISLVGLIGCASIGTSNDTPRSNYVLPEEQTAKMTQKIHSGNQNKPGGRRLSECEETISTIAEFGTYIAIFALAA